MSDFLDQPPRTRATDDPAVAQRIEEARREGRVRTIIMSVVIAGLAALCVVRLGETPQYNAQQDRSRKNCRLYQRGNELTIKVYAEQADRTLGNQHPVWQKEPVKPFPLKDTPFAKFAPLIHSQALGNRRRAREYAQLREDCNKIFPHKKVIPFIG